MGPTEVGPERSQEKKYKDQQETAREEKES